MKRTAWIVLTTLLALAGPAGAASRQAKNRCMDAAKILRSKKHYLGKEISPLEAKNAMTHAKQVVGSWKQAQAIMAQVPKGELDWKDPELKDCAGEILAHKNYMQELVGKLNAANAGASTLMPFLNEVKPYENSLYTLAGAHFSPATDVFNGRPPAEIRKYQEDMAAVEKICDEKMPDAGSTTPVMPTSGPGQQYRRVVGFAIPDSFSKHADNWCWIAKNRKKLLDKAAGSRHTVVDGYGNVGMVLPMTLKDLSVENPGMDTWVASMLLDPNKYFDKLQKARDADNAAMGTEPVAADNSVVEGWLKELQAKVDATAPQGKFPSAKGHDSTIESSAAKAVKRIYPEAKVVASHMDAAGWTIEKNGLGIPLNRYRSGQLAFSLPGSKWCLHRTFNWVEAYSGAGNYEPPDGASILPSTRFLACP